MQQLDFLWGFVSFVLTVMVLSYIGGDNPLFRLATYLFVGVAAGYVALVTVTQVIYPRLLVPLLFGDSLPERLLALIPLGLGILLLAKLSPRLARFGNVSMAYLVGVGAAVIIGGVVLGSLIPQFTATIAPFSLKADPAAKVSLPLQLIDGIFILVGTVTSLIFFTFGAKVRPNTQPVRPPLVETLAKAGQVFIGITLGAIFAGVYSAALAALIERVSSLWNFIGPLIGR
jgi:hypothetical protein